MAVAAWSPPVLAAAARCGHNQDGKICDQMTKKSNLEQLVEAGVLDPSNMGDEAKKIVNNEMTADEVKALISA
ncbi:MAG: hypothetical protein R3D25_12685 [Geminicoccaceae bacterium]